MDKEFLYRLESTLKNIRNTLLLNETIRTLLYYESDELNKEVEVPAMELVANNIVLRPIVEIDNDELANKKVFISITMPVMSFTTYDEADYAFKISVMADKSVWTYTDKDGNTNIRLYRLCQEIINELEGKKYDVAGVLEFQQMLETILDKTIAGKSLLFAASEGVGEV